ncbi:MAG: glycogen debranching protein [Chthoniobacteraceae bacterium]|nr:glycogen debranching protein [Chthoniobacteraceae bacterium]
MLTRSINIAQSQTDDARALLRREWLLSNGLGGYSSGTISGSVSRRYHGLLIAALPAPLGRVVMLNHLSEHLLLANGTWLLIGGEEPATSAGALPETHYVREFRLENGLPIWRYEADGIVLEKRLLLLHGQNTVYVTYKLLSGHTSVQLRITPSVHFRRHEHDVDEVFQEDYTLTIHGRQYEVSAGEPFYPLRLYVHDENALFSHTGGKRREISYQGEAERGYRASGIVWSPGNFTLHLTPERSSALVASSEPWAAIMAIDPDRAIASESERRARLISNAHVQAQDGPAAELVLAADQFIITPAARVEDAIRSRASGEEVRTVIAGYHWFTDWGRDTMISLEGLTLMTGRMAEARWILRTFAEYVRDGLIPNLFPEGHCEGLYHTADATMWFFHALDRYLYHSQDRETLRLLLPKLVEIVECHLRGTSFGIGVDPNDGLLKQGAEGYQLTWMDAKVDGWVVTPRRGKAVEINALWYNALNLLAGWLAEEQGADAAEPYLAHARKARASFNSRFWSPERNYLLDVVDGEAGDDPACRPNQILSISLTHPVLDQVYWAAVLGKVQTALLTPVGLRSLSREHPDYKPYYFGDLRARDAAYHQGTVWGWLIGPFVDAWLKVHPNDRASARGFIEGMLPHFDEGCIGSISEVFDAEAPFTPRGCIAQAWSVAEVLRCWVKTAPVIQ